MRAFPSSYCRPSRKEQVADDNLLSQLYDLTSICESIDGDDDKDEKGPSGGGSKNPFRVAVAMLLYR